MADATAPGAAKGRWSAGRIAALLIGLVAFIVVVRQLGSYLPVFATWVNSLGFWGPVVFVVGYIAAVVAFLPGLILTTAGGAIFGVFWGVAYVFVGAVVGSSLAFLIARYVARGAIEQRLAGDKRFAAIDRAVGREGLKIVFLLRLSPVFPFNLLNYALGLTRVSFRDYLLAAPGMLPGTLLYVYSGKLVGDVAALAGGATVEKGWEYYAVLGVGLAATLAVATVVARTARRALADVAGPESGTEGKK